MSRVEPRARGIRNFTLVANIAMSMMPVNRATITSPEENGKLVVPTKESKTPRK